MIGAAYGSVADIEIVWVLMAVIGVGFSLYNLGGAVGDLRYFKKLKLPPNGRRDVAYSSVIVETARLLILLIFVSIGVIAMFLPELPPNVDIPRTQLLVGIAVRWGLIVSSALIILQSFVNAAVRKRSNARAYARAQTQTKERKDD